MAEAEHSVVLDPPELTVEPGGEALCRVRIQNRAAIVDEFVVLVAGTPAAWTGSEPTAVRLFPDTEGVIVLGFRPPRLPEVAPGEVPFGVRVIARTLDTSVVVEGVLTILSFHEVRAELRPVRSRGRFRGRHRVVVSNAGNVPMVAALAASDPDETLHFRMDPPEAVAAAGATTVVRARAKPRHLLFLGTPVYRPFEVGVTPDAAPAIRLQGGLDQRRLIPGRLVMILLLLLALLIAMWVLRFRLGSPETVATLSSATPVPLPSPTPTAAAAAPGKPAPKVAAPAAPPPPPPPPSITYFFPGDGTAVDIVNGQVATLVNNVTYGPGDSPSAGSELAFVLDGKSWLELPSVVGQLGTGDFQIGFYMQTANAGPPPTPIPSPTPSPTPSPSPSRSPTPSASPTARPSATPSPTASPTPAPPSSAIIGSQAQCAARPFWDLSMLGNGKLFLDLAPAQPSSGPLLADLQLTSSVAVNDGKWHNVVISRMGTLVAMYVDGALTAVDASTQPLNLNGQTIIDVGHNGCVGSTSGLANLIGSIDGIELTHR